MSKLVAFALLATLAACGDDGAAPIDAPLDTPTIDTPPSPIAGNWKRDPISDEGDYVVNFEPNGTYRDRVFTGTWFVMDDTIVFILPSPIGRSVSKFYLSEDQDTLLVNAFRPTTATDGVVGTWSVMTTYGQSDISMEKHEIRADGTSTFTYQRSSTQPVPLVVQATWVLDGNTVRMTYADGSGNEIRLKVIPDVAIGPDLYHRVP